jgi:hypothetical protein
MTAVRSSLGRCAEAEHHGGPRCRRRARRSDRGRFRLVAGSSEPKALESPPPDEVVVIYPDSRDPDEPIACMFRIDYLMEQIDEATRATEPSPVPEVPPGSPVEVVPV